MQRVHYRLCGENLQILGQAVGNDEIILADPEQLILTGVPDVPNNRYPPGWSP